ncbi:homeobox-containing protein [Plasmodium yoelii yoelii]|uniref:Homeobox-containing protein n=1 Tax=Plasmodium yoelii yoelii TaxID=73239 RepID=Q7R922_PLAYO|nr:homeobox-containing protein [Plasmodium yoelii yoelii]
MLNEHLLSQHNFIDTLIKTNEKNEFIKNLNLFEENFNKKENDITDENGEKENKDNINNNSNNANNSNNVSNNNTSHENTNDLNNNVNQNNITSQRIALNNYIMSLDERFHIFLLLKILFILFLFEARPRLYFIAIGLFILYTRGFFDALTNNFNFMSGNESIEQVLRRMRESRNLNNQENEQNNVNTQDSQNNENNQDSQNNENGDDTNNFNEDRIQEGSPNITSPNENDKEDNIFIEKFNNMTNNEGILDINNLHLLENMQTGNEHQNVHKTEATEDSANKPSNNRQNNEYTENKQKSFFSILRKKKIEENNQEIKNNSNNNSFILDENNENNSIIHNYNDNKGTESNTDINYNDIDDFQENNIKIPNSGLRKRRSTNNYGDNMDNEIHFHDNSTSFTNVTNGSFSEQINHEFEDLNKISDTNQQPVDPSLENDNRHMANNNERQNNNNGNITTRRGLTRFEKIIYQSVVMFFMTLLPWKGIECIFLLYIHVYNIIINAIFSELVIKLVLQYPFLCVNYSFK